MLSIRAAPVATVGHSRVKPSVYFSPTAHPISNSPAMKKDEPSHRNPPLMMQGRPDVVGYCPGVVPRPRNNKPLVGLPWAHIPEAGPLVMLRTRYCQLLR
jgi:hypothetical protein